MVQYCKDCVPCCDCCLYSMHARELIDGTLVNGRPVGCFKHSDIKHQQIAEDIGLCEDFYPTCKRGECQ